MNRISARGFAINILLIMFILSKLLVQPIANLATVVAVATEQNLCDFSEFLAQSHAARG